MLTITLLALTLFVSVYDLRRRRVPNWATLPLLAAGLLVHFPGKLETWLACLMLFLSWQFKAMGAGDSKLWMALLWAAPPSGSQQTALTMWIVIIVTALAQMAYRKIAHRQLTGVRSPGAWRTIPFALLLVVAMIT